jgi:hypothetical protein
MEFKKTKLFLWATLFWIFIFTALYILLFILSWYYSLDDQNQSFWAILQIIISLVITLFFVDFTIRHENKKEYNDALNNLKDEIILLNQNLDFHNFYINLLVCEWRVLNQKENDWMPKKPSYGLSYGMYQRTNSKSWDKTHGLPGYLLQYLPSKAYYLFMEKGFYNLIRTPRKTFFEIQPIDDNRIWHLMEMYDYCIDFSQKSQEVEQLIHDKYRENQNNRGEIPLYYGYILYLYNYRMKPKFDEHSAGLNFKALQNIEYCMLDSYRKSLIKLFKSN